MPAYAAALATELLKHKKILCISVKDTGNGIPLEDQASIFERFVQSWRSDREYGGAGWGWPTANLP
jgi:signal transduction histidine kinase